jgi:hypothetical protein
MASNAILAAAGLVTSPNQLDTQEGSLSEASNVIIKRDGIIEQRRGFSVYGDPFPSVVNRAKQITSYRERIIRHYGSRLQFDSNAIGRFLDVEGQVVETEQGLRLKFIESNGNLYFTTRDGVKKLSAANSSDLALMTVEDSGIEKALDIKAFPKIVDNLQSGFLPQDSTVAYRVVWNKEDRNKNLITGAPSQRAIVTFPMGELIVRDTMRLLEALDDLSNLSPSAARIDDGNYLQLLKLQLTSSPSEIRTKLVALADKLDNDIILAKRAVGTPAPVRIDSAEIEGGIATIKFEKVEAVDLDALNALLPEQKQTYIIYKTTSDSKLYQWNGTAFVEREVLKDYFSSTLDVRLSGFSLTTRDEIQKIEFSSLANSGVLTIRYQGVESGEIPHNDSLQNIQSIISKVPGLEFITSVTGDWTDGFILTFSHLGGDLDQITVGSGTTLKTGTTFVSVTTSTIQNAIRESKGDLNGVQTILSVNENTITFNTQTIGVVIVDISAEIRYNEFRSIPEPVDPSSPALNTQLESLQIYLDTILQTLVELPTSIIEESDKEKIDEIDLTTTANVEISFTIPDGVTEDYFYQIYRSSISQAVGSSILEDLTPNDEMQLVYEAYPTSTDIQNKKITVLDETPDIFRGANLYTNAATGEGALQTNEPPPFAKDITRYRNSVFYANTRTKHRLDLNLLPVENLVKNYEDENRPKLTITNGTKTNTYSFITGLQEVIKIKITTTDLIGKSFRLFSARNITYRVYFNDLPSLSSDEIGVQVKIQPTFTIQQITLALGTKLSTLLDDFTVDYNLDASDEIKVSCIEVGEVSDPEDIDTTFDFSIEQQGRTSKVDENTLDVLLSTRVSIGQAVEETAKALVEAINQNPNEIVYAFYQSGVFDVPGKILLESRSLQSIDPFYVVSNDDLLGETFTPDISPDVLITDISIDGAKTIIEFTGTLDFSSGDEVIISSTNSVPVIDGIYSVTRIDDTRFSINTQIVTPGNSGSLILKKVALVSDNELKPNRVCYSKFNQPEAVPIINYFDLGASDKQIIRILPLRDSLFVFKEDGLFRISGETAPFQSELFDNSFILLAPDSLDVCNNVIYGWTTQGAQALTEGGATVISRNIDNIILKTQSNNYVNFKKATWGIGYESDNSYIVFTVKNTEDEVAEIAYRYSTITNTWTTYDKSFSCGHIADFDDHFYAGATDIASIEKERKTFSRLDYADREYDGVIGAGRIQRNKIILPTVANFEVGDVLVQDQTVSIYEFNQLLNKLDADSGPSFTDYFEKFKMSVGSFPKNSLVSLSTYLDSDTNIEQTDYESSINSKSGSITFIELEKEAIITSPNHGLLTGRVVQIVGSDSTPSIDGKHVVTVIDNDTFKIPLSVIRNGSTGSWQTLDGDFDDLKTCYNHIITKLNIDKGTNFNNYRRIDNNTIQETIITAIDRVKREVTTNLTLPFLAGEITVFKAIKSSIAYSPNTFGDPLSLKHLREATLMFETRTLTSGILSFATDLLPQFIKIPFNLDGNGIFGHQTFGENFFGGLSNSAPFRTYIPRQCQRCRYIVVKFSHSIAREDWRLLGTTMTGEVQQSTRAFR